MPSSLNLSHFIQKRLTQSFKKEIETRKNGILFAFLKIKNVDSFKSYKSSKLGVEKAYKYTYLRNRQPRLSVYFYAFSTPNFELL